MLCSWSAANSIIAAPAKAPKSTATSAATPSATTIFRQDYGYTNAPVRKILNESHGIFIRFLVSTKESEESKFTSVGVLQEASMEFRVCIRACCQALERELAEIDDGISHDEGIANEEKYRKLHGLLRLYRHVEIIWSLCDVLFFRPQGDFLAPDLLEWSRWNFTEPDDAVKEMLEWQQAEGIPGLEQHEKYWATVYSFLLTGRVDEAGKLLTAHSRASFDPAFGAMSELFSSFPLSTPFRAADHSAFLTWREDVKRALEDGYFMNIPQLEAICELLLGSHDAFKTLAGLRPVWYQLLVGRILFTQPYTKLFDLVSVAEECLELAADNGQPWSALDETLLSLFRLDILNALKELCSSFGNWWCAAHLGLLLWHGGCTELLTVKQDVDLREYLLFEYVESLMVSGFWQIAVDYFAACPTYGTNALRLTVERMALNCSDHHKVLKVLDICLKNNLFDTAISICKEKSISALKAGKLADALTWSLQAKDSQFATYVAEQILLLDGGSGKIQELHVLDGLGHIALISPPVIFLVRYRQMHLLQSTGQLRESASMLTELISSQIAPRQFWFILFRDFMDLVKKSDKQLLFDSDQIYAMMDVLQMMLTDMQHLKSRKYTADVSDEKALKDDLRTLKLILVENLSCALLQKSDAAYCGQ